MAVSPADFRLWASATGNNYPNSAAERAALTPEVFNFAKNYAKRRDPEGFGEVVHDRPQVIRHLDDNSVFQSPITPDNHIPKVAGTTSETLTGDHYENMQEDNKKDNNQLRSRLGKAALAAGVIAGGYALTQTPKGREVMGNVKEKVGDFLAGVRGPRTTTPEQVNLGAGRVFDADVAHAMGDVTPQTTAQNYIQEVNPNQTSAIEGIRSIGQLQGAVDGQQERQSIFKAISDKYPEKGDSEYVPPSHQKGIVPGGGYKVRETTDPKLLEIRRKNEQLIRNIDEGRVGGKLPKEYFPVPTTEGEFVKNSDITQRIQDLMEQKRALGPEFFPPDPTQSAIVATSQSFSPGNAGERAEAFIEALTGPSPTEEVRDSYQSKREELKGSTTLRGGRLEKFLGEHFGSSARGAADEVIPGDIADRPLVERSVPNIGPQAGVTQAASGTGIRGASRSQEIQPSVERTRDIVPSPEPGLRGTPPSERRPDVQGARLPHASIPHEIKPEEMSKQEVVQSVLNKAKERIDPYGKTEGRVYGTGIYGSEAYPSGAQSRETGEYSAAAERKPTELTRGQRDFGPRPTGFEKVSTAAIEGMLPNLSTNQRAIAEGVVNERTARPSALEASEGIQQIYRDTKNSPSNERRQRVQQFLQGLREGK